MRKTIIPTPPAAAATADDEWLDLDELAEVELTSEDPEHPVESALLADGGDGWRAASPGEQTIRLRLAPPQHVRRIRLEFVETAVERTQEYALRCSQDGGASFAEVVRQQWNFSPEGATTQIEEHHVDLAGVDVVELSIAPDISGGQARASLARLRIG